MNRFVSLATPLAALLLSNSLSHGAALALTEGPAASQDAYGTDVYVNFPDVYTSGQFTLSWFQNVQPTVDTIHSIYVSQGTMPGDFRTGTFPTTNGITGTVNPGPVPFSRDTWQQHVISIDLDTNSYSHLFNGGVVAPAGTTWDDQADATDPSLASMNLWIGFAGGPANADGIDGSVFLDDFLLLDSGGNELWSEDFEGGLGTFTDFGGAVAPVIDPSMQVPEPSTAVLGLLGLLCLTGRRKRS